MGENQELKVPKLSATVLVRLTDGHAYKGVFRLAAEAATHHGHERVKDLLNAPEAMIPFFNPEKSETVLLNKAHILMIELADPDRASDSDSEIDFADRRGLVVSLTGGIKVRGQVLINMPPEKDRTLDFLNRGERFFYLNSRDGLRIANLEHVIQVEEFSR